MDPNPRCPAAALADTCIVGGFDDLQAAERLAAVADVVTLDTEHVPWEHLAHLEVFRPVCPLPTVFRTIQDRLVQRRFLDQLCLPQTCYAAVEDTESLFAAARRVGLPALLKSRGFGYDGKGQLRVNTEEDLLPAWNQIGRVPAIMEAMVPFEKEVSVILARGAKGEVQFYPLAENIHRDQILDMTIVPAGVPPIVRRQCQELSEKVASALDYVGVMAVEMFLLATGRVLINEIAPRPHNSGHFTFGACVTSQFEQHVRAVCGLPLGEPSLLSPVVMVNLLGRLWANGEPAWDALLEHAGARLHLYGKDHAGPSRKMGHFLMMEPNAAHARSLAMQVMRKLEPCKGSKAADATTRFQCS